MIILRRRFKPIQFIPMDMDINSQEYIKLVERMENEIRKASRIPQQFFNR